MKLEVFENYSPSLGQRIRILASRVFLGKSTVDPALAAFYRPELLARPFYKMQHRLLRGKSDWSVEERELFAAQTSFHTYCEFCSTVHSHFARPSKSHPRWIKNAINGSAKDLRLKVKAILPFLEKLTKEPWNVEKKDVDDLLDQGLTREEIEDAAMICIDFNIGSRLSDAVGFEVPSPSALKKAKPIMRIIGYSFYT